MSRRDWSCAGLFPRGLDRLSPQNTDILLNVASRQVVPCAPAELCSLSFIELRGAVIDGAGEVDQVDMLMAGLDVLEQDADGRMQALHLPEGPGFSTGGQQLNLQATLLGDFSKCGIFGQFVDFDMPSRWQPGLDLVVPQQ